MENIGGGLGFRATLDIDDFTVSAQAMERQIKDFSSSAISEVGEVEDSIQRMAENAGRYISYYLIGQGMHGLVNSIIQTRGQFQQLEIAFETMLGSTEKATTLMNQMIDTAAKTPFDLMGVAEGAKQLMAYGVSADKVNDTLVRLGNIASGLSIPLNDIVYLYGTTMVQGRLYAQDVRQFTGRGIPLVKELAEKYHKTTDEINAMVSAGKIGFADVEEVLNKMTNAGGQFYNLMEKQSASLTGQIANLEDAWDTVLNDWGEANEGLFAGAITSATYLVEHMDTLVRVLKAVAIGYGSVKAAIVLNSVATKGYTGIAVLDNAARSAKLALMKTEAALKGTMARQQNAMTAAENAYVASLETSISAEERNALIKQLRIGAIQSLLTVQQQEHLSNIGLTASSIGYEEAALSLLTVEQRLALSKIDLTTKGAAYRATVIQNTQAELQNVSAKITQLETEKKAALESVEAQKIKLIAVRENINAISMEMAMAGQNCDMTRAATLQTKMAAATDQEAAIKKNLLAAQSVVVAKSKELEATSSRKAALASNVDNAAKAAQTASTNALSTATGRLSNMFKTLFAVIKTNPLGFFISILGIVYSVVTMFFSKTEESTDAMSEFGEETRKVTDKLKLYFSILQNTEKGTKTHKDALEKINAICQEYNKTLLDENATLEAQREKYQELTKAIQENTAQKIIAKRTEKGNENRDEKVNKELDKLDDSWDKSYASYFFDEKQQKAIRSDLSVMRDDVREYIRGLVADAGATLSEFSGDKFTQEFDKTIQFIMNGIKATNNFNEAELKLAENIVSHSLDRIVSQYKIAANEANEVATIFQRFNNATPEITETEATDYAKKTFEDLDKLVVETQKEIDIINAKKVKVDTDNTRLNELLEKLKEVKGAISTREDNLNTEEGISNRIKQLKDARSTTAKFKSDGKTLTEQWKELGTEIDKLQNKLNQGNSKADQEAEKAKRAAETLAQKKLDAEKRLEEARIAVMEDGYDKRKALLDLQHKQNLAQIAKEEKELIEARKKAGKGGLTATEQQGFEQRRTYENQSYQQAQNKLFDGELDYKRKQYELYWRWVENMGKDVADKQFASLLQSGSSYKEYIEKQISNLTNKQKAGENLSEGEGNFLITLKAQYDELTGAKTALEAFKEQVDQSVGRAQTLAEKIEAVAKAKEKLENGKSGIINDDDRAAAALDLERRNLELQKELRNTVLTDYRTFEEQKSSIVSKHILLREEVERQAAELRKEAEETGNKEQLQIIENTRLERLRLIKKSETEELSTINTSFLQQSDSWKKLFSDLDTLSVGQISKLISDVEKQLNSGNLQLSPIDFKAVIDSLSQAKDRIQQLNPFAALDTFFNDYLKAKDKLAKAKAALAKGEGSKEDVESAEREVKAAANGITQSVEKVTDITTECASSLQNMFDALGMDGVADGLGTAIELMGQLGNAAASVGQFMSGDIIGGVTGMISSITSVIGIFSKLHDAKYEKRIQNLQKQIDALERSYNRLERAFNNTYWVFNEEERAGFEQNIKLIEGQIDALEKQRQTARRTWDFAQYAKLTAQIKDLNGQLSKAKEGDDMLGLYEQQKKSLREQQDLMRQQIDAERSKKKTDYDKIQQWNDAIEQIEQQIEDLDQQMMETFAGTTTQEAIDQYADAIVDAYCAGEDAAKALGDTTREVLKKAVVDALKRQFLAKAMDEAVKYLGDAMSDGVLTDREKETFELMTKRAGETFTNALEAVGDWIKDVEDVATDPLTGAVTSMSEETGGVIAGRLNAFIINQTVQTNVMREQLLSQTSIAQNTAIANTILTEVRDTLKRIETKDNSLLSQGIS